MFLVDDILLFPFHGLFWIFREINQAAEEELGGEAEAITAKLTELYMMLETGQMTEQEFDALEKALLDRLDAVKKNIADEEDEEEKEAEDYVTVARITPGTDGKYGAGVRSLCKKNGG